MKLRSVRRSQNIEDRRRLERGSGRALWFERGYDQARIAACDTFSTDRL